MKQYYCNPINVNYKYQFNKDPTNSKIIVNREAADPSIILFKGRYYIFASMSLSVWVSDDLVTWESHNLPKNLPLYGYAPDARVIGEYVYFCANNENKICDFYRTTDVISGPYEKISGTFNFSDPNLFMDDDGRMYFYWGLSSSDPIWGVELEPKTMCPIGEKIPLVNSDPFTKGYERVGEDNSTLPCSEDELEKRFNGFLAQKGVTDASTIDPFMANMLKSILSDASYIEGAWMTKHDGKYYLQYAFAGTHYNIYGDGVYVSKNPLGPFQLARNNPYSYNPGGFFPGAGHGSTFSDKSGDYWHGATMRISLNHQFERRVGLWKAGFDNDGELFCDQRYGDWPIAVENDNLSSFEDPDLFLLSYKKSVTASSFADGFTPENAVDENVRTWWKSKTNNPYEWLEINLNQKYDVKAVQINFADDNIEVNSDDKNFIENRYIEEDELFTRWILEGSIDGDKYFVIKDKSNVKTDLSHDFVVLDDYKEIQYLRLNIIELPYNQTACISGFRVFGKGNGGKTTAPKFEAVRISDIDMQVNIEDNGAVGYNILWGHSEDKLYHSYLLFGTEKRVGALIKDEQYFVRVDSFNENGITEGKTLLLKKVET